MAYCQSVVRDAGKVVLSCDLTEGHTNVFPKHYHRETDTEWWRDRAGKLQTITGRKPTPLAETRTSRSIQTSVGAHTGTFGVIKD